MKKERNRTGDLVLFGNLRSVNVKKGFAFAHVDDVSEYYLRLSDGRVFDDDLGAFMGAQEVRLPKNGDRIVFVAGSPNPGSGHPRAKVWGFSFRKHKPTEVTTELINETLRKKLRSVTVRAGIRGKTFPFHQSAEDQGIPERQLRRFCILAPNGEELTAAYDQACAKAGHDCTWIEFICEVLRARDADH